ncbi:MAG: hypothetical protein AAGI53_12430 [Planctomycetota bacterium]
MRHWISRVDGLLRADRPSEFIEGSSVGARKLLLPIAVLAATYGVFMGAYALRSKGLEGLAQLIASTVKLPLLVFLTAAVTLPSLYVFSTILGSRLGMIQFVRTVAASCAITSAVAASLGPILGFFTVSTTSYPFMVLLNVALLGVSGVVGTSYLLRMLGKVQKSSDGDDDAQGNATVTVPTTDGGQATFRRRRERTSSTQIVWAWVVLYAIVGVQMGWVLRPFIGSPDTEFTFLRPIKSNAAEAIFGSMGQLMGIQE